MSDQSRTQADREIAVNAALHTIRKLRSINPEEGGEDYERFVMTHVVDTVLARPECDLRIAAHQEKRATDELDIAGVEKYDQEDRADSTDDSAGQEWATWKRIRFLRLERDRVLRDNSRLEAIVRHVAGMLAPELGFDHAEIPLQLVMDARGALRINETEIATPRARGEVADA